MPSPFYRATFRNPVSERDEDGQIIQRYDDAFNDRVEIKFLRGTEAVMQARLNSRSPVILTVRNSSQARAVTSEWTVEANGKLYDLKEDPRPTENRRWLEMLAEARI